MQRVNKNDGLKTEMVSFINKTTHRENLEEKSTKQVAAHFNIDTKTAYKLLSEIANDGQVLKLDPVNGDKFDCCGWIRLNDDAEN